jgi:hypothetical protein
LEERASAEEKALEEPAWAGKKASEELAWAGKKASEELAWRDRASGVLSPFDFTAYKINPIANFRSSGSSSDARCVTCVSRGVCGARCGSVPGTRAGVAAAAAVAALSRCRRHPVMTAPSTPSQPHFLCTSLLCLTFPPLHASTPSFLSLQGPSGGLFPKSKDVLLSLR